MEHLSEALTTPVAETGVSFIWAISIGQILGIFISVITVAIYAAVNVRDMRWIKREVLRMHEALNHHAVAINKLDDDLKWLARVTFANGAAAMSKGRINEISGDDASNDDHREDGER